MGYRHLKNLSEMGLKPMKADLGDPLPFDVDFAVVSTPTVNHALILDQYLSKDISVFCEKPVSDTLDSLNYVESLTKGSKAITMVACNIRFTPGIEKAKLHVLQHSVKSFYTRVMNSNPKRGSYEELPIEDVHELDYLTYLFGDIESYDLKNLTKESYEASVKFKCGTSGIIEGNSTSRKYVRDLFLDGTLFNIDSELNEEMYVREIKYFVDCLKTGTKPMNSVEEACGTTRLIIEALYRNYYPSEIGKQ